MCKMEYVQQYLCVSSHEGRSAAAAKCRGCRSLHGGYMLQYMVVAEPFCGVAKAAGALKI